MRKNYTKEFKLQALELAGQLDSYADAARKLGIEPGRVYAWKAQLKYEPKKSGIKPTLSPEAEEIKRLRKENEDLKNVNYILKRAAAFFSQDHLK
jgi:transposase